MVAALRAAVGWIGRGVDRFASSRILFHIVVAALLLVPHLFGSRSSTAPYYFGIPRVEAGDEPHYLVYINSLLEDHDLDLTNNYDHVHHGGPEAGLVHQVNREVLPLDHHAVWFVGERRVAWFEVYEQPGRWGRDQAGERVPTIRRDVDPNILPTKELPWNVPGLAILLALVLAPFARTPWVEPASVIVSGVVTILGTFAWRRLARGFTKEQRTINLGMALAYLGTPAWHYGRSLFAEPYLIALLVGVVSFAVVRPRFVLSGFLMGAAIYIKPFIVVAGIPIGIMLLLRRQWANALRFGAPVLLWIGALLGTYHVVYGAMTHSPNDWVSGPVFLNALHILAYPTRGLLTTAPIVLVALAGWSGLVRREPAFLAALAACVVVFVLAAWNRAWAGGWAYSVRYIVPIIPLACVGLIVVLEEKLKTRAATSYFTAAAVLSVLVNGLAAIQYWRAFNGHPFVYFLRNSDF